MQDSTTPATTDKVGQNRTAHLPKDGLKKPMLSRVDREERDEAIRKCFRAGMSAAQIVRLSQSWKHPLNSPRRVFQIFKRLRLVRSQVAQPHVREANEMLIDVILDGAKSGWETFFWEKESSVGEGLRSDFMVDMRKGSKIHLYFGEMQISDLTVGQWIRKLLPYLELYDNRAHPFYVLIRCAGAYNNQRVQLAINQILEGRDMRRPFLISHGSGWKNRFGQAQQLIE